MTTIEKLTSGAFQIESWRVGGLLLAPPIVEGRFLLVDGTITTILRNRSEKGTDVTSVLLGTYTLSATSFAYEYLETSIIRESGAAVTASHLPLWEGPRIFEVEATDAQVFFRSRKSHHEFEFTARGISYSENGEVLRLWRRAQIAPSAG
jgi:hypothetical protein